MSVHGRGHPYGCRAKVCYKTPAQFRYTGKDMPVADLDDLVRCKETFGIDAKMPGMVYAAIERPCDRFRTATDPSGHRNPPAA